MTTRKQALGAVGDFAAEARKRAAREAPHLGELPDGKRLTDAGNADRLIEEHGEQLRYVRTWGRWLAWDGQRWLLDTKETLTGGRARSVARRLLEMIPEVGTADERKALLAAAMYAESAKGLRAMIEVARSDPSVTIHHDDLDAQPQLVTMANGTLDLGTGKLRDHDPDDLLTMRSPVVFDAKAKAPTWQRFVKRVLPDADVRLYVQSRLGACLSGEVREHELHVHNGDGANGKTTAFLTIDAALGDFAIVAPKSLLILSRHEHHPTDKATLFRRRLAYAGEIPDGAVLNEALVKELTGGDEITARRMREDFWSFTPTHKLHLFANHLPRVNGTDHGIWRRLRVVPWSVKIPDDEQDRNLAKKMISDELAGVFNWLLEGYRRWHADDVTTPAAVLTATSSYRAAEDTVSQFITDELQHGTNLSCTISSVVQKHEQWCAVNGIADHQVQAHYRRVIVELERRGAERGKNGAGVRIWHGIATA